VGFSNEDYVGVSLPHTDDLVVILQVANHLIHMISWIMEAQPIYGIGQRSYIWI